MGDGFAGRLVCGGHLAAGVAAQRATLGRWHDLAAGPRRLAAQPSGGQPERTGSPGVSRCGQHQHQQSQQPEPPKPGPLVPVFLWRTRRAKPGWSGQWRHRQPRRPYPDQQPRHRGCRRHRGGAGRWPQGRRQGHWHRPRHRFGAAQNHPRQTARDRFGANPGAASGRCGAGHWQPLWRGPDRDLGHRQRSRSQPVGHQHFRKLHPDRRRHQPRQLGRCAGRREWAPDGHQHRHLFPLGRQHGHWLCHPHLDGQAGDAGSAEKRQGHPGLDRGRTPRHVARAGRKLSAAQVRSDLACGCGDHGRAEKRTRCCRRHSARRCDRQSGRATCAQRV